MQPDLQSILVTNIINDLKYSVGVQHRAWSDCTEVQADMGISWSLMIDFLFGEAYKFFHIEIRKDCCVKGKSAFKHAQNLQRDHPVHVQGIIRTFALHSYIL